MFLNVRKKYKTKCVLTLSFKQIHKNLFNCLRVYNFLVLLDLLTFLPTDVSNSVLIYDIQVRDLMKFQEDISYLFKFNNHIWLDICGV